MVEILRMRDEIQQAQQLFLDTFRRDARQFPKATIGYQGGQATADVFWHEAHGIWGSLNPKPPNEDQKGVGRYWNVFGTEDPTRYANNLSIDCEINPTHAGVNRQVAGFFAKDGDAQHLLHKGRLGGSKPGLTMEFFWRHFRDETTTINGRRYVVVAKIGTPSMVRDIARFVRESARIKSLLAAR